MEFYTSSNEYPASWEELTPHNWQGMQQDPMFEEGALVSALLGQDAIPYEFSPLTWDVTPIDPTGVHQLLTSPAVESTPLTGVQQSLPVQAGGYNMHQNTDTFRDFTSLLDVTGDQVVEGWRQGPAGSTQPIHSSPGAENTSPGISSARSSSNRNNGLGEYRPRGSEYRPRATPTTSVDLGDLGAYRPRGSAYTPRARPTPIVDIDNGRPYRPRGSKPQRSPTSPRSDSGVAPDSKKRRRSSSSQTDSNSSPKRQRVSPASQRDVSVEQAMPSPTPSTAVGSGPIVAVEAPQYPVQQPAEESTPEVPSNIQDPRPTDPAVNPVLQAQNTAPSDLDASVDGVHFSDAFWPLLNSDHDNRELDMDCISNPWVE